MVTNWLIPTGETRAASGDTPSASRIYRNVVAKDGFPSIEATTLFELFQNSVSKYSGEKLLGWRPIDASTGKAGPYEWLTYGEVNQKVQEIASGLAGLGVKAGDRVGVYGVNCCEWMMAMQVGVGGLGAKAVVDRRKTGHVLCEAGANPFPSTTVLSAS
jgi:long-chain acyl-CoA synthetase